MAALNASKQTSFPLVMPQVPKNVCTKMPAKSLLYLIVKTMFTDGVIPIAQGCPQSPAALSRQLQGVRFTVQTKGPP